MDNRCIAGFVITIFFSVWCKWDNSLDLKKINHYHHHLFTEKEILLILLNYLQGEVLIFQK